MHRPHSVALAAIVLAWGMALSTAATPATVLQGSWNAITDSDLEDAASAAWETDTDFPGELIVTDAAFARSGERFARFGDSSIGMGTATLGQVTAPLGTAGATLSFWIHVVTSSGAPNDVFHVLVDGIDVWSVDGTTLPTDSYVQVEVQLDQFADGTEHSVEFEYAAQSGAAAAGQFHVDLIELWTWDPPVADFDWSPHDPAPGETVQFTDRSMGGPDGWSWDFGDGTSSEEQNPLHAYEAPGRYTVTLTVTRSSDGSQSAAQAEVVVSEDLVADFEWQPQNPSAGSETAFFDRSSGGPDTWHWDFGDGFASDERNPVHVFAELGVYPVTLTISKSSSGAQASVTYQVAVSEGLVPEFTWDPAFPVAGDAVQFTDLSSGPVVEWLWDFGDGAASDEQNPVHVYDAPGTYQVQLSVGDAGGAVASVVHEVEVAAAAGEVDFTWQPQDPHAGEAVTFFPAVTADCPVADWWWDFGDGSGSQEETPAHVYEAPGEYQVTLEVSFDSAACGGNSTVTHVLSVRPLDLQAAFVFQPESPAPGDPVQFFDTSQGGPDLWYWEFGDGAVSDEQNPVHAYDAPGTYPVTLTIGRSDDATAGDSVTQQVVVGESVTIDFTWQPDPVTAWQPVTFTPQLPADVHEVFWDFGDGDGSQEIQPSHVFVDAGRFLVALWAAMPDGTTAYAAHEIDVQPPSAEVHLLVSNSAPDMGEPVDLFLDGAPEGTPIAWDLQDPDCEGHEPFFVCQPQQGTECRHVVWRWSDPGTKVVAAWIVLDGTGVGPFPARVVVSPQGGCSSPPVADFEWWPAAPTAGEPVQFADRSAGGPTAWQWSFGDGSSSQEPYPEHVFQQPGTYTVGLTVANEHGGDTRTAAIQVSPAATACGDGTCSADESAWSCPEDCGSGPEATGRSGEKGTSLAIPAAASHQPGLNDTLWFTEGTILNPGTEPAQVVARFVQDDHGSQPLVQRLTLPARSGLHFEDLVGALFDTTGLGSLRLSSDDPVVLDTRTYNTSPSGTYGQGISGILRRRTLGQGEGGVFLLGMKQDARYRTNLLFQETTGRPAAINVAFHDRSGAVRGAAGPIDIPAGSRRLVPLAALGSGFRGRGYCTIEVSGEGRVAIIGSVVDQRSGDAVTVDAIHPGQLFTSGSSDKSAGSVVGEGRYLVAVVARTPGLNGTLWRSEVTILNPSETESQDVRMLYIEDSGQIHQSQLRLEAGQEFSSQDVVGELFPGAGQGSGALHVTSQLGVAVNSRTYTVLDEVSGATAGQSIPGLASGDLIQPGEVWLISNLKSTDDFRCNLGFSEFEGSDTHVTVTLFDMSAGVMRYLATKTYTVPAFRHVQVTQVFDDMGLEGTYPEVAATVVVADDAGTVYAYASIVDNESGDATTILPKRQ